MNKILLLFLLFSSFLTASSNTLLELPLSRENLRDNNKNSLVLSDLFHQSCINWEQDEQYLYETLLSIDEKKFDQLYYCVQRGIHEKDKFLPLYLRLYALTLATKGNIYKANQILYYAVKKFPMSTSNALDLITANFIQNAKKRYSIKQNKPHIYLVKNSSIERHQKDISEKEKGSILDILWGTGEIIGGIFISAGGYRAGGVSLMTKGAYDIGKGIMSIIEANQKNEEEEK